MNTRPPTMTVSVVDAPIAVRDALIDAALASPLNMPSRPVPAPQEPAATITIPEALVDTYSTDEYRPGVARVQSATADVETGIRHTYELGFCWTAPALGAGGKPGRFRVTSCGCIGFYRKQACRHAIALFDILNAPAVAAYLLPSLATEASPSARPASVLSAYREGACGACGGERWSIVLYVPVSPARLGSGYLRITACASCDWFVVR